MRRRWHRWRRAQRSRLAFIIVQTPGSTITASGRLVRSRRLSGLLIERRTAW